MVKSSLSYSSDLLNTLGTNTGKILLLQKLHYNITYISLVPHTHTVQTFSRGSWEEIFLKGVPVYHDSIGGNVPYSHEYASHFRNNHNLPW